MNIQQLKIESQLLDKENNKLQNYIKNTIELEPDARYRKDQIIKLCNNMKRKIFKIIQSL